MSNSGNGTVAIPEVIERLSAADLTRDFARAVRTRDLGSMLTMLDAIDAPDPEASAHSILQQPELFGSGLTPLPQELVGAAVMWLLAAAMLLGSSAMGFASNQGMSNLSPILAYYPLIAVAQVPFGALIVVLSVFLLQRRAWARSGLVVLGWVLGLWEIVFAVLFLVGFQRSVFASAPSGFALLAGAMIIAVGLVGAAYFGFAVWLLGRGPVLSAVTAALPNKEIERTASGRIHP